MPGEKQKNNESVDDINENLLKEDSNTFSVRLEKLKPFLMIKNNDDIFDKILTLYIQASKKNANELFRNSETLLDEFIKGNTSTEQQTKKLAKSLSLPRVNLDSISNYEEYNKYSSYSDSEEEVYTNLKSDINIHLIFINYLIVKPNLTALKGIYSYLGEAEKKYLVYYLNFFYDYPSESKEIQRPQAKRALNSIKNDYYKTVNIKDFKDLNFSMYLLKDMIKNNPDFIIQFLKKHPKKINGNVVKPLVNIILKEVKKQTNNKYKVAHIMYILISNKRWKKRAEFLPYKKRIIKFIAGLNPPERKNLLKPCLDKNTLLGEFFWKKTSSVPVYAFFKRNHIIGSLKKMFKDCDREKYSENKF